MAILEKEIAKKPYGFVYITTNLINNKKYIGQKKYDKNWKNYLGSGNQLINAIKKYGRDNFKREIIDLAYSENELNKKEKQWINSFNAVEDENYYNMIEGGNVQDSLKRKNSVPIICIDNNFVFKSILDASVWSGYTYLTIKQSFQKTHTLNKKEKLIFRPITSVIDGCNLCSICGDNFIKKSNRQKKCKYCSRLKGKVLIDHDFNKSKISNVEVYKLTDKWVLRKIELNDTRKTTIGNKKVFNKLEKMKEYILNLYLDENFPLSNIVKKLSIPGLNNITLEYALLKWGEKIRKRNKIKF